MMEQAVSCESPSFKELCDALRHYRKFGLQQVELYNELHHRFSSLEEEKAELQEEKQALDVRVLALEDKQRQLESELQEKDRRTDETKEQLVLEVASLRTSEKEWKDRCARREEEAASAISALQEEQQQQLRLLRQENRDAAAGFMAEKAALAEESRSSVARLIEVEALALSSQAQWMERRRSLEAEVQSETRAKAEALQQLKQFESKEETWMAKEKEWIESKARTKQDIQVLVDQILKLNELASMNDWQKAKFKWAQEKKRKQAAKKREEERRERTESKRKKI